MIELCRFGGCLALPIVLSFALVASADHSQADDVVAPKRQIVVNVRLLLVDRRILWEQPEEFDENNRLFRFDSALGRSFTDDDVEQIMATPIADVAAVERVLHDWQTWHHAVNVLAEATLVATDGEPASFHSGEFLQLHQLADDGRFRSELTPWGSMCDVTPIVQDGGIVLDLRCQHWRVDWIRTTYGGYSLPAADCECDRRIKQKLEPGKWYFFCRPPNQYVAIDDQVCDNQAFILFRASFAPPGIDAATWATPAPEPTVIFQPRWNRSRHSANRRPPPSRNVGK